jgi:SAC3 family protein LENG8/THP3
MDPNDQVALMRRAERFQREHEIEKAKNLQNGSAQTFKPNLHNARLFRDISLSRGGSPFSTLDEPEADPVLLPFAPLLTT